MAEVKRLKEELALATGRAAAAETQLAEIDSQRSKGIAERDVKIGELEGKVEEYQRVIQELQKERPNTGTEMPPPPPQVNQSSSSVQNNPVIVTSCIGSIEGYERKEDWTQWLERFEHFMTGNSIDSRRKKELFLNLLGKEGYALLTSLCAPSAPKSKLYSELVALMSDHLKPKPSVITERFKFNVYNQQENQSISDYLANLKKLSTYCDFGSNLNDIIRDRFVCGLRNTHIKKKLLGEKNLTYQRAVELALNEEAAARDTGQMDSSKMANGSINLIKRQRDGMNSAVRYVQCECCGKKGHSKTQCRFKSYECSLCHEIGHLKAVCRFKRRNENERDENFVKKRNDNDKNVMSKKYDNSNGRTNGRTNDKPKERHNYLDEITDINIDFDNFYSLHEDSDTSDSDPVFVEIFVEGKKLRFETDSGSPISAISEKEFNENKIFANLQLRSTNRKFRSYTGGPILPCGVLDVNVAFKDKNSKLELFVMPGVSSPIVGRQWMRKLEMLPFGDELQNDKKENVNNVEIKDYNEQDLLNEFPTVLTDKLGRYNKRKFALELKENFTPIFCKPRTLPYAMVEKVETELERLVKENIIKKVETSEWATPIVPVIKSNGQVRLCGDYKITINKFLKVNRHPIPKIPDLLRKLNGAKVFTKIDLSNAFLQLSLDEISQLLTTITTHKGLFVFLCLPFGPASSPGILQECVENELTGIEGVISFFDDILIFGKNKKEHDKNLIEVLTRLKNCGLTVRLEKCNFFQTGIDFLGFKIDKNGIHVQKERVEAIFKMPAPNNITELKSFLGMTNFYSKFINNYAKIVAPLYKLLQKDVPWVWSENCQEAFVEIKEKLISSEVLTHYDPELPIKVTCDASPVGVGAVLSHKMPDNSVKPIAFVSRVLTKPERNYAQLDREALGIVFAVKSFHQYLFGREFLLETDHKPLKFIFGPKKGLPVFAASRVQRWAVFLSGYNFVIEHIKGKDNVSADCLSRMLKLREEERVVDEFTYLNYIESDVKTVDANLIKCETENDEILSRVCEYVKLGWPNKVSDELEVYKRKERELTIESGCLMWGYRVIIPNSLREMMLRELHSSHMGIVKMKALVRSYFWWPGVDADIERVAKSCDPCMENSSNPPRSVLHNWKWPEGPNQRLHVDFLGPVGGRMYFLIIDAYSKWIDAKEMSDITSKSTMLALDEYFRTWGYPEIIVSDNGPSLTSAEFEYYLQKRGILHVKTAPYHPASNGAAENAVKTFKSKMKLLLKDGYSRDDALTRFLMHYRAFPHCTTGCSPAELQFSRLMKTEIDLIRPNVRGNVLKQQLRQRENATGNRQCILHCGDIVMAKDVMRNSWIKAKVIEKLSPVTYVVKTQDDKLWKRHIDQLRLCLKTDDGNRLKITSDDSLVKNTIGTSSPEVIPSNVDAPLSSTADPVPTIMSDELFQETVPTQPAVPPFKSTTPSVTKLTVTPPVTQLPSPVRSTTAKSSSPKSSPHWFQLNFAVLPVFENLLIDLICNL